MHRPAIAVIVVLTAAAVASAQASTPSLPSAGTVAAKISLDVPGGLLTTRGAVWVTLHDKAVARVDPATNQVAASRGISVEFGAGLFPLASGGGSIWIATLDGRSVYRLNPSTTKITARFRLRHDICGCRVGFGGGAFWLVATSGSADPAPQIVRIQAATGTVTSRVLKGLSAPLYVGIVYGAGAVWASVEGKIVRVDPHTLRVKTRIGLPGGLRPWEIAFGAGAVWVTAGNKLFRIDTRANRVVAAVRLPGLGGELAASPGGVGLTTRNDPSNATPPAVLWRVDPQTNTRAGEVDLGVTTGMGDVAIGDGVWTTLPDAHLLVRVAPA